MGWVDLQYNVKNDFFRQAFYNACLKTIFGSIYSRHIIAKNRALNFPVNRQQEFLNKGGKMAVTASIDFRVYLCTISLIDILSILSSHGWNFSDSGHQVYLPINDNDEWYWKSEKLNNGELFDIFHIKSKLSEPIGVAISWQETNIGGQLLLFPDGEISVLLNNNRLINSYGVTDFDWYLNKIVPIFREHNIVIEKLSFTEHI